MSHMGQMQQTQNLLLQNIMSQTWPALPVQKSLIFSDSEIFNEVSSIAHSMFDFIFMNIGHLISINKQKITFF